MADTPEENLAGFYLEQLNDDTRNPIQVLNNLLKSTCNIYNDGYIPILSRMRKLYGKSITFYAILELASSNIDTEKDITKILFYFAKKLFNEKNTPSNVVSLDTFIAKVRKDKKKTKVSIGDPFEEN